MSEQAQWNMGLVVEMRSKSTYGLNQLNVRSAPRANASVLTNVATFAPTRASFNTVSDGTYNWYRIENDTVAGYIASSIIEFTLTEIPAPPVPDDKQRWVIDFKNETLIVDADHLEAVQEIFKNLYVRAMDAKLLEENE